MALYWNLGARGLKVDDVEVITAGRVVQNVTMDAAQLTGTLDDARVPESAVTQHEDALAIAYAQLSDPSAVLDAVQSLSALGTGLHVLRVNAAGDALEFAEVDAGVDLAAAYAWTGAHSHTQALTLASYLQGTTANGYLDLRGDSGATSGVRVDDTGRLLVGTTSPGNAAAGGLRAAGLSQFDAAVYVAGQAIVGAAALPFAAAALEVRSTTGFLLLPRMTTTERDAVSNPQNGSLLYNTTTGKIQGRAGGAWVDLH